MLHSYNGYCSFRKSLKRLKAICIIRRSFLIFMANQLKKSLSLEIERFNASQKNMYSQKEEGICSFVEKKSYVYARYEKQGLYRP